jgi:PAS domain S-box-containing protein
MMRGLFAPPVFADQELTLRARSLFYLLCFTAVGVTIAMAGMTLAQPELIVATSMTAAITLAVNLGLLLLLRRGAIRLASLLYVVWGVSLIAERAIHAGGIRSPGMPMLYVFALVAGLLLGEKAGIATAIVCAGIGLALVGAEHFGVLPPATLHYSAISYWWLSFLYMCVVVMLIRMAVPALRNAFASQQKELAERRNAERKLQVALEAGEIGVWEWVPSTGALSWDERMYQLYGREPGSPVDYQAWASTLVPGELSKQETSLQRAAAEAGRQEREFRIRTPAGVRYIFAAEKSFPAQDGEPVKLVGINVDVTERRQAEAEIWALKGQLETLVNKAKVGILIHRRFKPLVANPELAAIFGYASVEEVLAQPDIRAVMNEQVRERATQNYLARVDGADPRTVIPVRCRRKDGSWIDIEARGFPIYWNGEPSMCAMITDVTQQRRLETQLRQAHRLEAVGQLTGGIAHDFNNLLTVILGNADALERMLADNPVARELAGLTRSAAERGSELTSRLLSFSRQQTLNIQPADVETLVAGAHGLIRRTTGDKVEIRIVHGKGLWRVFTDAAQMESALLNLAINARDAMPEGGVLSIETRNVGHDDPELAGLAVPDETGQPPPPGDYVLVAVSDTGAGMDEETRERAFEPFFTTKDVGKGSGLGLSMVYGFVKQLRGLIRIESEPGRGSVVKLYLPRAPQTETGIAEARQARPLVGGSEKILLVEDNDLVREQCAIQLRRLGYHVLTAEDGQEGLAILEREEGIRLLFSDVSLPKGINGPELAARARLLHPGLPVLLSSGYAGNARIEIDNLGMRVAVLNKPYYQDQLAAVIRDLLQ